MAEICEELTLEGNCVFAPIELARTDKESYTQDEMLMLAQMHKEKIKLSDAVFIVDIDGYIGNGTKSEIELAQDLGKEIIYYSKRSV